MTIWVDADDEIVKRLAESDLVITADIPLAAEAIKKGALALSPRGNYSVGGQGAGGG